MMPSQIAEYLRAKANRCRELAASASDEEAAAALRQMADDMEAAVAALESSPQAAREDGDAPERRRTSA